MNKGKPQIVNSIGNPFSDSQARNYSDMRVISEFCPISQFWSLFNDQHEVLIGTRGCGKTILLKMMRYSMLRKIIDPKAQEIVNAKNYVAFYVPLHLEFIKKLSNSCLSDDQKITWFRFSFNCVLAQSVILELSEMLKDLYPDDIARVKQEYVLAQAINDTWHLNTKTAIHQFWEIRDEVSKLYYNVDPLKTESSSIPPAFLHSLGSSLTAISPCICGMLSISPTWILCVDEAEFLDECYQRCINTALRSDTDRIAIKMATLPFYHTTKKTLDETIEVMNGQDFKYTIIDMKYDSPDFINVTNTIVNKRFAAEKIDICTLNQFVQTIGNDLYLDYYTEEVGQKIANPQNIQNQIISQLSESSQKHNSGKTRSQLQKPVINKLAPIFYLREIYKKKRGRYIPGWYAGATMIRRIAQGNPRIFIRIMNDLFDKAKGHSLPLRLKSQHAVIESFAKSFCKETKTLEAVGPEAEKYLEYIATIIHEKTHNGELTQTGLSFKLKNNADFQKHIMWLQKSVAFSRLFIDNDSLITGITSSSVFELSNLYAANYWLPMRSKKPMQIELPYYEQQAYVVNSPLVLREPQKISRKPKSRSVDECISGQLSLLPDELNEESPDNES